MRIGIIAPSRLAGTIGECGLRGTQYAVERINAAAASPGAGSSLSSKRKPTRRIPSSGCASSCCRTGRLREGIVSSGVSLAMGAVAEEMKASSSSGTARPRTG